MMIPAQIAIGVVRRMGVKQTGERMDAARGMGAAQGGK